MFFADRFKAVLLLWVIFVIYISCFSLLCCLVAVHCSLVITCWEMVHLLALLCVVCLCFVTDSYGVLGQVCILIVPIPDLCLSLYFYFHASHSCVDAENGEKSLKNAK